MFLGPLLGEVSEDDRSSIDSFMQSLSERRPHDTINTSTTGVMSILSVMSLRPEKMLYDEVIDYVMCILQRRDIQLCSDNDQRKMSHFFKTSFLTFLIGVRSEEEKGRRDNVYD